LFFLDLKISLAKSRCGSRIIKFIDKLESVYPTLQKEIEFGLTCWFKVRLRKHIQKEKKKHTKYS